MVQKVHKTSVNVFSVSDPFAVEVTMASGAVFKFGLPDKDGFRLMTRGDISFKVKIVKYTELLKEPAEAEAGHIRVGKSFHYMPQDCKYGYWYTAKKVSKILVIREKHTQ